MTAAALKRERRRDRVRTPTLLQQEAAECGATALGIVLQHYGRHVSGEALRTACGVSRNGSTALNLVRAAEHFGLRARGLRHEDVRMLAGLPLPAILFWNFNHFVVFEGFGKGRAYINDPATGPRAVSMDELDAAFTGVALTFEPGPEFVKTGRAFSLARSLWNRMRGGEMALIYLLLVSVFLLVPGFVVPAFLRVFVDDILLNGQNWLGPLLVGTALALVARAGLTWMQQAALLRLETRLAVSASSRFVWHVLHLPYAFFTQRHAADIAHRVQLNDRIAQLLSGDLATSLIGLGLMGFYGLVMLLYDVPLTLLSAGFVALNLLILRALARQRDDANRRLQQERSRFASVTTHGLRMVETLKATGDEDAFFARWAGLHADILNSEQALGRLTYTLSSVPVFLMTLNVGFVLILGGARVLDGMMTVGMLVAFQSLLLAFAQPIHQLAAMSARLQEASADLTRLDDVLRSAPDASTRAGAAALDARLRGALEMRDICFGFSPLEAPLIAGFNLSVGPGQRVALVGPTGSGKSTVARLAAGLYRPWAGEVLYDGQPRERFGRELMTLDVALVDQQVALFSGTVRENLTLWDDATPHAQLMEATKDACIHERILAYPDGFEHRLAENGRNLSGGERQRLDIARALVSNPAILILDEATSALDARTEQRILNNLRRRGCTCLIVSHRLSAIRDCDEIIVMDGGKIAERGTHEALMSRGGLYAALARNEAAHPAGEAGNAPQRVVEQP